MVRVAFLSDQQIPNFEMQSEVGAETGVGHLDLGKLETEDLGDHAHLSMGLISNTTLVEKVHNRSEPQCVTRNSTDNGHQWHWQSFEEHFTTKCH